MAESRCGLLARWNHERKRARDIRFVWVNMTAYVADGAWRDAWEQFTAGPGQEHWRCACGEESAAVFRAINFRADAGE